MSSPSEVGTDLRKDPSQQRQSRPNFKAHLKDVPLPKHIPEGLKHLQLLQQIPRSLNTTRYTFSNFLDRSLASAKTLKTPFGKASNRPQTPTSTKTTGKGREMIKSVGRHLNLGRSHLAKSDTHLVTTKTNEATPPLPTLPSFNKPLPLLPSSEAAPASPELVSKFSDTSSESESEGILKRLFKSKGRKIRSAPTSPKQGPASPTTITTTGGPPAQSGPAPIIAGPSTAAPPPRPPLPSLPPPGRPAPAAPPALPSQAATTTTTSIPQIDEALLDRLAHTADQFADAVTMPYLFPARSRATWAALAPAIRDIVAAARAVNDYARVAEMGARRAQVAMQAARAQRAAVVAALEEVRGAVEREEEEADFIRLGRGSFF